MEGGQKRPAVAAFANATTTLLGQKEESKRHKQRGEWSEKWLLRRNEKGLNNNLVSEMRLE